MKAKLSRPIFGTDLDGVIADTDPVFRRYIEKITGKSFRRDEVISYFYEDCLPITKEDVEKSYKIMDAEKVWEKIPLIEGASNALNKIAGSFDIFIITARPFEAEEGTLKLLKKHKIPFKKIFFLKDGQRKKEIFRTTGIPRYFVEDRLDFAEEIAAMGVKTFLLDYPWNRNYTGKSRTLIRVKSWKEILENIKT